jgi:tetratricopeptide (TPR) repeat protein
MKPLVAGVMLLFTSSISAANLPDVPEGAQAITLSGKPLYPTTPDQETLEQLADARKNYEANPDDADNIIWYGRRTAYAGDFRGAIEIYSEGIEKFPDDDRMYRHRGHRYISIREFDRAIADLEQAAKLIGGRQNEIEPDGQPNAQNIPVSSRHGNIWYHLPQTRLGERITGLPERFQRRAQRRQQGIDDALAVHDQAAHGRCGRRSKIPRSHIA